MALQPYHNSTLLPENLASLITAISIATRLSLRCSSLFIEVLLEAAKYSTSFGLGLSRQALIAAVSSAKRLHMLKIGATEGLGPDVGGDGFLQVLDQYTNLGIYIIHHSFTLAELFAMSGFHLTSQTFKTGFKAAEESVRVVDGIFGSNQTSRAIASIVTLVRREISQDEDFKLAQVGKVAVLAGLTKALTAFAFLQNVTHKRTMISVKMTHVWEGVVVVEEDERSMIEWNRNDEGIGSAERQDAGGLLLEGTHVSNSLAADDDVIVEHPDIIRELEDILALENPATVDELGAAKHSSSLYDGIAGHRSPSTAPDTFEIVKTTRTITVKSTTIRPIGPHAVEDADSSSEWVVVSSADTNADRLPNGYKAKTIVVREDQEQVESFMATVQQANTDGAMSMNEPSQEYLLPGSWVDTPSPSIRNKLRDDESKDKSMSPVKSLKIMLSTMTKKLQKRKVERTEQYNNDCQGEDGEGTLEVIADKARSKPPTTTMTTTSTTMMTTTAQYQEQLSRPSSPSSSDDDAPETFPDNDVARPEMEKKSRFGAWDRFRLRSKATAAFAFGGSGSHSKSNANNHGEPHSRDAISTSKGESSSSPLSSYGGPAGFPAPMTPLYVEDEIQRNDPSTASYLSSRGTFGRRRTHSLTSIASIQSVAHTTTTTTYTTTPSGRATPSFEPGASQSSPSSFNNCAPVNTVSPLDLEPSPHNFPRSHLIQNIGRFMRYASAAYGESFMRILGIGSIPHVLPVSHHHHPNHHAFSHHTGVPVEDILLSSYTDRTMFNINNPQIHALVHYVTVDHNAQAVVLTCRGTLGLSDVLTDLTCEYAEFVLPCDKEVEDDDLAGPAGLRRKFRAHAGMLGSAQLLATQKGKVYRIIKDALEKWSEYGLVLCGHSLGAGVASLLSVLWSEERDLFLTREKEKVIGLTGFAEHTIPFVTSGVSGLPAGRPIHCYAYGVPCTMSLELAKYCGRGLVTSVVHSYDIVPSLSLGLLKDFKNVAMSLHEEGKVTEEILARILGKYRKSRRGATSGSEFFTDPIPDTSTDASTSTSITPLENEDEDDQWFWALIKTMRADMRADKLYPPLTLYHIEAIPQLAVHMDAQLRTAHAAAKTERTKQAYKVVFKRCDDVEARFSEIVFSRSMFSDHSPREYEKCVELLWRGVLAKGEDI
ncbi:hypothetical protein BC936DRAFT_143688 [Jimgerdemannia flammicorona]|uniref:sn-1-specific diacylglycerol lipase n=1 Tax=Jimgerdemannia flammicorona TaxID=994334 RepID=A0A433DNI0_9FUNG|nr:hypothetical protein BC936DRAFT_143688 [Jimgerdemannia flammicorona]